MKTYFLDFEASSLDDGSFPIEIAWVGETGQGESYLIRPEPTWTNWSVQSQKIHGISRPTLWKEGVPADQVARRVMTVLKGTILVSDNPSFDVYWLSMLLGVICEKTEIAMMVHFNSVMAFEIQRLENITEGQMIVAKAIDPLILSQRIRHRALSDAQQLWEKWKAARAAIDARFL